MGIIRSIRVIWDYMGFYGDYIGVILGLCVGLYKDYTLDMRSYSCL